MQTNYSFAKKILILNCKNCLKMTISIIITLCVLVLLSYFFDLTSKKTRIPSVILLLLVGWGVRQISYYLDINVPDLSEILPIVGTIGLILIVLEGSMELELSKSKKTLIFKSVFMAILPMAVLGVALAYIIQLVDDVPFKIALTNALPLCIISSAIAIPSVRALTKKDREFVTYETSISDIIGVIAFNFISLNEVFGWATFGNFFLQILLTLLISFAGIIGLSVLLNKINHSVKFIPIIILLVLFYAITKYFHLPGLIFILLFGMFLGNLNLLYKTKWAQTFHVESLKKEFVRFNEIVAETTFLVRTLFFLLFGFLIETSELLNLSALPWAIGITLAIFIIRYAFLKLFKVKEKTLYYIAPRGLITILLFLSITPEEIVSTINKPLVTQIVILSSLVMMIGLMVNKKMDIVEGSQEQVALPSDELNKAEDDLNNKEEIDNAQ